MDQDDRIWTIWEPITLQGHSEYAQVLTWLLYNRHPVALHVARLNTRAEKRGKGNCCFQKVIFVHLGHDGTSSRPQMLLVLKRDCSSWREYWKTDRKWEMRKSFIKKFQQRRKRLHCRVWKWGFESSPPMDRSQHSKHQTWYMWSFIVQ